MIEHSGNPFGLKRLPLIPGDANPPHLVGSACKPVLLRGEERNLVFVMKRQRGRKIERERKSCNAGVPFRHAFNSFAGISAIFNRKCHRMSTWKMSLGKDWRVTSNLPFKMK